MKANELIRMIEEVGFVLLRNSGHIIYGRGPVRLAIPHHRMLNGRTVHFIMKKAGLK
jgi:predicted RNA binding protein YcfA (HicA-like mRNA interferase family)